MRLHYSLEHSAVHLNRRAGDVRSLIRGQEDGKVSYIFRRAVATQRYEREISLASLLLGDALSLRPRPIKLAYSLCVNAPRRDVIHRDPVGRKLHRQRLGEPDH